MASAAGKAAKVTVAMEVATAAGTAITATGTHGHTGEMIMITTAAGDIKAAHTDPHGIEEVEFHGAMALHIKPT